MVRIYELNWNLDQNTKGFHEKKIICNYLLQLSSTILSKFQASMYFLTVAL